VLALKATTAKGEGVELWEKSKRVRKEVGKKIEKLEVGKF
jgi:hypothetical protein